MGHSPTEPRPNGGAWKGSAARPIEVSVKRSRFSDCSPLVVHRPVRLPGWQLTDHRGLTLTTPARTILDVCAVAKPWESQDALDSSLCGRTSSKSPTFAGFWPPKQGRDAPASACFDPSYSSMWLTARGRAVALASRFLRELRKEGLLEPVAEFRVAGPGGFVKDLDFAYPELRIGFEIDGYRIHHRKVAFDQDRESDAILLGLGWRIFRVTDAILRDPLKCERLFSSVRSALNSNSRRVNGRHVAGFTPRRHRGSGF